MFKSFFGLLGIFAISFALNAAPAFAGGHGAAPKKDSGGHGEAKKGGDGGHGSAADTSDDPSRPQYVKISPLILPMIGDNGVEQVVSLVIVIEVQSRDIATEVIGMSPKLNDAFITDLYGAIDRRDRMRNGLLDVSYIKERLTKLTVGIMGPDKIKGILVQGITQRPA